MTTPVAGCPVRKLAPVDDRGGPPVERVLDASGERWVLRTFELARTVLRDETAFSQAGFGAGTITELKMRRPILYLEGAEHRAQRRAAARLFAPKVVESYRPMMTELSERLVAELRTDRPVDLSTVSLRMAVEVAARVVGLTNSSLRGMTRRLDTFFEIEAEGVSRPVRWLQTARRNTATLRFFWLDVKPAIRHRRRHPGGQDDVIAQLIQQEFSDLEILTECLTYGAAGMVTTREFITVAAWHLLDDPALLARFRAGDRASRTALLEETLRLEPVVGHLLRRSERAVTLPGPDGPIEIASGDLVDLDVRAANADAATVGEEPLRLCPGRDLPRGVPTTLTSFGDGHHRCPGAPIAILETEIFLSVLFGSTDSPREVIADGPPRVRWNPVSTGYDLDRFGLRLGR